VLLCPSIDALKWRGARRSRRVTLSPTAVAEAEPCICRALGTSSIAPTTTRNNGLKTPGQRVQYSSTRNRGAGGAQLRLLRAPMLFIAGEKSWEQPELTALNTLPPHALLIPFSGALGAFDATAPSPWLQSLRGTWEFKLLPRPEAATEGELAAGGWARSRCPASGPCRGMALRTTPTCRCPFRRCRPRFPLTTRPACTAGTLRSRSHGAGGVSCCTSPAARARATSISMANRSGCTRTRGHPPNMT